MSCKEYFPPSNPSIPNITEAGAYPVRYTFRCLSCNTVLQNFLNKKYPEKGENTLCSSCKTLTSYSNASRVHNYAFEELTERLDFEDVPFSDESE